jgi:hypothetical protein
LIDVRALRAMIAALAALAFTASTAPAQDGAMPAVETLTRQFDAIAFTNEFGGAYRRGRIVRWEGPIRVRIEGWNAHRYHEEVRAQLNELARLSGLSIELVNWASVYNPPNLVISFSTRRGSRQLDPNAPCLTLIYDRGYVIRRVEIFIAPYNAAQRRHCIAEELTQALGLADDSTVIRNSIFNDESRQPYLESWDTLMVRVLYDPAIRPGMHRSAVLPIARRIIRQELFQTGVTTSD